jgi:ABC-type phosphate/phosphonate transport system ATPase subunit
MMTWEKPARPAMTDRGMRVALIFALAAERLTTFYEHAQWMTEAQGASLAADWLARSQIKLPLNERRQLSGLSDQLARQIAGTLSREAGMYTAHEMMESLDPNHHSEIAESLMKECERLLDEGLAD